MGEKKKENRRRRKKKMTDRPAGVIDRYIIDPKRRFRPTSTYRCDIVIRLSILDRIGITRRRRYFRGHVTRKRSPGAAEYRKCNGCDPTFSTEKQP